jgi:hypothetical protein
MHMVRGLLLDVPHDPREIRLYLSTLLLVPLVLIYPQNFLSCY